VSRWEYRARVAWIHFRFIGSVSVAVAGLVLFAYLLFWQFIPLVTTAGVASL
jgi:hypothetical protein